MKLYHLILTFGLVMSSVVQASVDSAFAEKCRQCALIQDSAKRALCLDSILTLKPPLSDSSLGKWHLMTDTNEMTDQVLFGLSLTTDQFASGQSKRSFMQMFCSEQLGLFISIDWGQTVNEEDHMVSFRVDSGTVFNIKCLRSQDYQSSSTWQGAKQLAREMLKGDKLRCSTRFYSGEISVFTFDVRGFRKALEHLPCAR